MLIHVLRNWLLTLAHDVLIQEETKDASHDYDHIERVIALAETIQQKEGGDLPIIWAAAAFHDVGQERERQYGGDHALIGAAMAHDLLVDTPFPQASIPAVEQAIREHRMTGNIIPATLEGRILYDADKIDCLGAIGIARLYSITGRFDILPTAKARGFPPSRASITASLAKSFTCNIAATSQSFHLHSPNFP